MVARARIAVVGLGVAGATVALLLARQGHAVTVFEQTPEPGPVGAGVLLQPSGQLVLERLGLLDPVVQNAEPIERLYALTHRGKTLIDLPYGELGEGVRAYGVQRGVLFTVLFEALRETSATLRLNVRACRYVMNDADVALFDERDEPLGGFDFLVACDGARSALRSASGVPASVHEYPHGALWAIGRCPGVRGRLWQVTRGSRRMCGLLPMGGGACSLFWSLDKADRAGLYGRGFAAWREEVLHLCPEAAPIFDGLRNFEQTTFATYLHVHMPRPFDARCVFLGDAGHAMSPHLGQGINLALLDGYCFAYAAAESADFREACRRFAALRREHIRVYAAVTYLLSPFFQSRGVVKGWLRDVFLPWMPRIPVLRRQMILTMSGMRGGFLGGRVALPADAEAVQGVPMGS